MHGTPPRMLRPLGLFAGLGLAALLGSVACTADAPSPASPSPAPASPAPTNPAPEVAPTAAASPPVDRPAPAAVPGTAAPRGVRAAQTPAEKAQLDAVRGLLRGQHFQAQTPVPLPAALEPTLTGLVPPKAKLIEVESERRMHHLVPAPARRRVVLRWLSRGRAEQAAAELASQLVQTGWIAASSAPTSPVKHAERGTLSWTIHTPDERATRVELVFEGSHPSGPLPAIDGVLSEIPPWRALLGGARPTAYEFGRYHARRAGSGYTDLERLAAIFETDDAPGLQRRLEQGLIAAGYRVDDDEPRLLRAPGEMPTTFTTRIGAERLTLHHQRRWRRASDASPAEAAGPKATTPEGSGPPGR